MRKLFKRRPSAGVVIGFIALCVALGGGAYAASKKKIEYKGLSKDARLKVLGVSSTNAQTGTTPCDPTSSTTFTKCTSVSVDGSTGFPRKYLLVFDGVFTGPSADGVCQLEVDSNEINGTKTERPRWRLRVRHQHRHHPAGRRAHLLGRLQRNDRPT